MNKLRKLDRNLLTSFIVYGVSLLGFIASSFLLLGTYKDIPLGFLFSGVIIGSLYLLSFFFNKLDLRSGGMKWGIIFITIRLVLVIGVIILLAFMNYRWEVKIFNLFVFVGIYTVGVLSFVLLNLFNKNE